MCMLLHCMLVIVGCFCFNFGAVKDDSKGEAYEEDAGTAEQTVYEPLRNVHHFALWYFLLL